MRVRFGLTPFVATVLLGMSAVVSAQTTPYSVTDLGRLPGTVNAEATDLNNQLQVVGVSDGRPFVWESSTGMRELAAPGTVTEVRINDAGLIAGDCQESGRQRICVWRDGALEVLTPPFEGFSIGMLTESGILLVQRSEGIGGQRSWALVAGAAYDLTTLFGGTVYSLNSQPLVGGVASDGQGYVNDLAGRLRHPFPPGVAVRGVGEGGHLAGAPAGGQSLYLAQPDGTVISLPGGPGLGIRTGGRFDINRNGDFIATLNSVSVTWLPLIVRQGHVVNIESVVPGNLLRPFRVAAVAIADGGSVAGWAEFNGQIGRHAVLYVPNLPAAPARLFAAPTGNIVGLRWDLVEGATNYRVEAGSTSGARDLYDAEVGNVEGISSSVPPGTYYVRVRAVSPAGLGPPSPEVVFTIH